MATAAKCETRIEENGASGRCFVHSCEKLCITIYDQKRCRGEKGGVWGAVIAHLVFSGGSAVFIFESEAVYSVA